MLEDYLGKYDLPLYIDAGGNKRMDINEESLWSCIRPIEPTKW